MFLSRYDITLSPPGSPERSTADIFLIFDWWGWWGIVTCTALGLVSSHLVLYALNRVSAAETADDGGHHVEVGELHRARKYARVGISILLVVSVVLIIYGSTMPAYIFAYKGMTKALAVGTNSTFVAPPSAVPFLWTHATPPVWHNVPLTPVCTGVSILGCCEIR
jgi:drug/metabolite transporter (DMT)-like permease